MTMWLLATSGGWLPARGYLHSNSVNAQRMRPHMPGAVGKGCLIRGGQLYLRLSEYVITSVTDLDGQEPVIGGEKN